MFHVFNVYSMYIKVELCILLTCIFGLFEKVLLGK